VCVCVCVRIMSDVLVCACVLFERKGEKELCMHVLCVCLRWCVVVYC
jgi:hypothetical protein